MRAKKIKVGEMRLRKLGDNKQRKRREQGKVSETGKIPKAELKMMGEGVKGI